MITTINVTQDDIDKGCVCDSSGKSGGCMVWRAVHRALPELRLTVGYYSLYLERGVEGFHLFELNDSTHEAIEAFDKGKPVSPFSFSLDLPAALIGAAPSAAASAASPSSESDAAERTTNG